MIASRRARKGVVQVIGFDPSMREFRVKHVKPTDGKLVWDDDAQGPIAFPMEPGYQWRNRKTGQTAYAVNLATGNPFDLPRGAESPTEVNGRLMGLFFKTIALAKIANTEKDAGAVLVRVVTMGTIAVGILAAALIGIVALPRVLGGG